MPKVNMNVSVKGDISKTEGTEGALNVLTASHAIEQDAIVKERERKALERGDAEYWKFRAQELEVKERADVAKRREEAVEKKRIDDANAPWYKNQDLQMLAMLGILGALGYALFRQSLKDLDSMLTSTPPKKD